MISPTNGVTDTQEPWRLIAETPDYLIINKPTRMLTQPGKEAHKTDSLITRVAQEFPEARIVHRLDWDTSGIMVLARTIAAHRALSIAFQERQTEKRYQALVDACPHPESGLIDLPIGADYAQRPRYRIDYAAGRTAQTRYRVLENTPTACRLALEPITGRSHQLRVHLLAQGSPIQGDSLYHPNAERHPRLMLHAEHLAFPDPTTGQWQSYQCPVPF
jgi:tRNA pseudouridine32 synthase/23S rRNA pseudouridine746 synthase